MQRIPMERPPPSAGQASGFRHQPGDVRLARVQKGPQPRVIVRRNGGTDRRSLRKLFAPSRYFGLARKDTEVADAIEDVEVAEDRTENGVHQREAAAVEIRPGSETPFEPSEFIGQLAGFSGEGCLIRRRIEAGDIVE